MTKREIFETVGEIEAIVSDLESPANATAHNKLAILWNRLKNDVEDEANAKPLPIYDPTDRITAAETYRKMFDDGGCSPEFKAVMKALHDIATGR